MQRAAARWAVEVTDAALTGGHPERLGGVAAVMGSLARADGRAAERRAEDADDARDARRRLISTTESALTAIPVTRVVLRTGQTLTTLFGDGLLDRWMPASNHLVDELRRSGRRTLHYLESIAAVVEYLTAARGFGAEPRDPVITAVLRGMARRPTVSADIAAVVGDAYIDEALAP
jgi:hypothetical protein